ncbi:MAG: hypothetical protein ACKO0Z_16665 [Betaproteobacteria bacterium]
MIRVNRDTGFTVDVVAFDRDGRNYYGSCEVCGKPMSEVAIIERHKIFEHVDGFLYLSAPDAATYSHMACKMIPGRLILDKKTISKKGDLLEIPAKLFKDILSGIGFSEESINEVVASFDFQRDLRSDALT